MPAERDGVSLNDWADQWVLIFHLHSPRTNGCMLGLIFGRRFGLGWDELRLCRFLPNGPSLGVSDFLPTGPLGEGIATVRGLGATELDVRSPKGVGLGSRAGATTDDVTGDRASVRTFRREVSMRATCDWEKWVVGVAASGRITSSMISSCDSDDTGPDAWPIAAGLCCGR